MPPNFISRIFTHRPHLLRAIENAVWLCLDRGLRMGVSLTVGIWFARYLGPEQFGIFNYAIAFVSLFGVIAPLGLNGIVVRDLIKSPQSANAILGTAFILHLLGSLFAVSLIFSTALLIRPEEELTQLIIILLSICLIFQSSSVIKYWFESQVQSKYSVLIENSVFIGISVIRGAMIFYEAPLVWFAWVSLAEAVVGAIGLFLVYSKITGKLNDWTASIARAKSLLRSSWPLVLSGIAIMIYIRIDQIMLGQMIGEKAVGIYSAAVRISEVWYTVPMIIVASVFPNILKIKYKDSIVYKRRIEDLLNLMVTLAFILAIIITLESKSIIYFLYGDNFAEAAGVLTIHIWAGVFVFIGVVGGNWYLAENLQHLFFRCTLVGALLNIALNLILIPKYGVQGSAIATVISQAAASYILDVQSKSSTNLFFFKTKALLFGPFLTFRLMYKLIKGTI